MQNKVAALTSFTLGIILLTYTWKPVIGWYFLTRPQVLAKSVQFLSPLGQFTQKPTVLSKPAIAPTLDFKEETTFSLSIEKFGIQKARVVTGDNFLQQLAHLPGSAKPGGAGNVFISGHSALPQLFSPENYWSIFSKLYLLEVGDKVILEADDKSFIYLVTEMLVAGSTDTWVVVPPNPYGSYLTLLTCGVGGFTQDRIVVRATLVDSQKLT